VGDLFRHIHHVQDKASQPSDLVCGFKWKWWHGTDSKSDADATPAPTKNKEQKQKLLQKKSPSIRKKFNSKSKYTRVNGEGGG